MHTQSSRLRRWSHLVASLAAAAFLLQGCGGGDDGAAGAPGAAGKDVDPAVVTSLTDQIKTLTQAANPETCATCHGADATVAKNGPGHQAEYNKYTDASKLSLTVDSVASVANGDGTFTSTMTFTAKKSGVGLTAAEMAALDQKTFYASTYNSATGKFDKSFSYTGGTTVSAYTPTGTAGQFTVKAAKATFAPEASTTTGAQAYAYIVSGKLDVEGMQLYDDVANAAKAYGDAATYVSAANNAGCVKCHGSPYMKHGYRAAVVANLSDFGACKNCHYDTRVGGHMDWQLLKDDPAIYAEYNTKALAAAAAGDTAHDSIRENMTAAELAKYPYKASIMNDVHMAHNMEFAYPQSMKNCVTCHEGKLDTIFAADKFKAETCISCHSVDGIKAKMAAAVYNHSTIELTADCAICHKATGGVGPSFKTVHSGGYEPLIYTDAGVRYSDAIKTTISSVSYANKKLTIKFSATGTAGGVSATSMTPTVLVGLYGYDTKDFLVAAHGSAADGKRNLEYVWGDGNPRFTPVSAANGSWEVTADLTLWADKITAGTIKRAEIAVLPTIIHATETTVYRGNTIPAPIALDAPSKTFNFTNNAFETYFADIVKTAGGCNTCHDALATTFHLADRGNNIRVCRICHEVSNPGSHLELQSRSIDSYIHSIHSFQAFDPGDIDFADPEASLKYQHHIASSFPNFTIKNCEACHNSGMYNVPNQSKSMPGVLSGTDTLKGSTRDIGVIPAAVTGPAVRACGGCHRAQVINGDDAAGLATLTQHFKTFGYVITNETGLWASVVEKVMALFK